MRQRSETIQKLANTSYDVCVIGGGASGAGCALDAQLRGLATVLLEAGDFGSATSSASTKLIHGGLRYLQQAVMELDVNQYRLVRQALHERRLMMRNAPNLVQTREFAIPCFSWLDAAYFDVGSKLYDWLSGESSLSHSRFVGREHTLTAMPCLRTEGLKGAVLYSDGQFDDARYNLALVQSCSAAGGDVLNYARVVDFEKSADGKLAGAVVEVSDVPERVRVRARVFVNATGPFSDTIRRLADSGAPERLRLSKGVHILLPLPGDFGSHALLMPKTEDGRLMFAIPWQGRLLVGTTETEATLSEEMAVTQAEAEYLLRHLSRYLSRKFQLSDIVSAMVGLRPLLRPVDARDTKRITRDYEIEVSASGLTSILGGKWTIYRAMAEDAVDTVQRAITGRTIPSATKTHLLHGCLPRGDRTEVVERLREDYQIPPATARHLLHKFGARARYVLGLARQDSSLLSPLIEGSPQIRAEVVYAIREEMAISVEDILSRRLGLQHFDWRSAMRAAPPVARMLAAELGWTATRMQKEIDRYTAQISRSLMTIGVEDFAQKQ
jgi:glycerol-3-phosphate dehydrogenase